MNNKKKKKSSQEVRSQNYEEAKILASLDNNSEMSEIAKNLNAKWIEGKITSQQELEELIKYYKK